MRLAYATALVAFLAAGCTPMQWVKPHATSEQLNQDFAACQQEAWREARVRPWYYRPLGPTIVQDQFGRRFFAWPGVPFGGPFGDPFHDPFMEESRLAHFCMRAKGYALQAVEPTK